MDESDRQPADTTSARREPPRKLAFFGPETARDAHTTPLMRPPTFAAEDAAREVLPEFGAAGGSRVTLLFGDPESADGGAMSLVSVRFAAHYLLPRHAHDVDCLYYIHAGSVRMGSRTLGVGEGFYVPAGAPYSYQAGPDGVELLEFRNVSSFDTDNRETADGWRRILDGVRRHRDEWADAFAAGVPGQW